FRWHGVGKYAARKRWICRKETMDMPQGNDGYAAGQLKKTRRVMLVHAAGWVGGGISLSGD
ncbi:MAG: hypothetical protein NT121_13200, partial [Chloroflexi bacterium]|nr:hypothetical protein [Chloroflexota bacterium]